MQLCKGANVCLDLYGKNISITGRALLPNSGSQLNLMDTVGGGYVESNDGTNNPRGGTITVSNTTGVSAVLEALAAESARLVSPAYYEQALKVKYTRDSDAGDMIDLIYSHISTDFAFLYSSALSNMAHIFRTNISSKTESLSSSIAKSEKAWNKTLERFVEKLDEVADKQG